MLSKNKFNYLFKSEFYKFSFGVFLVGCGAGLASYLMHIVIDLLKRYAKTDGPFGLTAIGFSLAFTGVSYLLTKTWLQDTTGSGIPQVKIALVAFKGRMGKRLPGGKFITTILTLASGLSFGKEGPMITIGASWGHLVAYILKLNRQLTKLLTTAGATAGLSAAFNTPIAAVIFTLEELLGQLNTKYLGPIILTSVLASVTSYKLLGNQTTFIHLSYKFNIEWHLILFLVLGLIMSSVGFIFVRSIIFAKDIKKKYFKEKNFLFIVIVVGLAAGISQFAPETLGDGVGSINLMLAGKHTSLLKVLGVLFLMKFILSSASYSTGLSGGIFMPVLFLGAVGGNLYGHFLHNIGITDIEIGVCTLMGMTSLLVAVIRAPFTAFIMIFELTGDYELILPLMTSSIVAYWFSYNFDQETVYETLAEYEGVHLPGVSDNECLHEMSVEEAMVKDVASLRWGEPVANYEEVINQNDFGGFPVLKKGKLVGVLNRRELKTMLEKNPDGLIGDLLKYNPITIYADQSLVVALDKMKRFDIGRLPVVSRVNDKQLLGIITPKDIINYLDLTKQP